MFPLIAIQFAAAFLGQASSPGIAEVGRLSDRTIEEASALEGSMRYPGVYWTVSDSGNPPRLYAIEASGKVLATYRVAEAVNLDWECLAVDETGRIFICDVGNNAIEGVSRLKQRWVYIVREPDPRAAPSNGADPAAPRTLPLERTIFVRYPQAPFDIESAFAWKDDLFFVSKTKENGALYRLDLKAAPQPAGEEGEDAVTLEKVIDLPGLASATSASLSPDRRRLAVSTYRDVWLYEVAEGDRFALAGNRPMVRMPFRAPQVEACAWEGRNLLLLSELGVLYRLSTK